MSMDDMSHPQKDGKESHISHVPLPSEDFVFLTFWGLLDTVERERVSILFIDAGVRNIEPFCGSSCLQELWATGVPDFDPGRLRPGAEPEKWQSLC